MPHVDRPVLSEPLEDRFKNDTNGPMAMRVGPGTCYLPTRCWLSLLVLIESWHISGQSFLDLNLILVLEKADQVLTLTTSLGLGTSALGSRKQRQHSSYSLPLPSSPAATPSACPHSWSLPAQILLNWWLTRQAQGRGGGASQVQSFSSSPQSKSMCSQKTQPRWKCLPFSWLSVIFSILEVWFPAILGEYREEEGSGSWAQRGTVIKRPLISVLFLHIGGQGLWGVSASVIFAQKRTVSLLRGPRWYAWESQRFPLASVPHKRCGFPEHWLTGPVSSALKTRQYLLVKWLGFPSK